MGMISPFSNRLLISNRSTITKTMAELIAAKEVKEMNGPLSLTKLMPPTPEAIMNSPIIGRMTIQIIEYGSLQSVLPSTKRRRKKSTMFPAPNRKNRQLVATSNIRPALIEGATLFFACCTCVGVFISIDPKAEVDYLPNEEASHHQAGGEKKPEYPLPAHRLGVGFVNLLLLFHILEFYVGTRPRERLRIADVCHAGQIHQQPVETDAEPGVDAAAVAAGV